MKGLPCIEILKELGVLDYYLGFISSNGVQLRSRLDKWGSKILITKNEGLCHLEMNAVTGAFATQGHPVSSLNGPRIRWLVGTWEASQVLAPMPRPWRCVGQTNFKAQGLPLGFPVPVGLAGHCPIYLSYVVKALDILVRVFNTEGVPEASL